MKKLMLSTAFVAVSSVSAVAQDTAVTGVFIVDVDPMTVYASDFIGMRVYTSETEMNETEIAGAQTDWNDIGEINDVVLTRDGSVQAVLVDIGGFLGLGERQVALDMSAVRFVSDSSTTDDAEDFFLVVNAPRATLEEAPEYGREMADATLSETNEAIAEVERDGYMAAEPEYLTTENLTGARVYDANDEWIGEVSELLVGDQGQITEAVVDVGGFLGIGEKPVALGLGQLDILRQDGGDDVRIYVSMTKEELEAMPNFGQ